MRQGGKKEANEREGKHLGRRQSRAENEKTKSSFNFQRTLFEVDLRAAQAAPEAVEGLACFAQREPKPREHGFS